MDVFERRIDSLRSFLKTSDEALLLSNEVNIGYFSGFFHSEGYLLVTQNSVNFLVDFRYMEAAQKKSVGCKVICFKKLLDSVLEILKAENIRCVYTEASDLTVDQFERFRSKFAEDKITALADGKLDRYIGEIRIVKDESEIQKIAFAQKIAEKAYLEVLNYVKPSVTEKEIAARLEFLMKLYGAEDKSFDTITITGTKTSLPHGVPSDNVICEGDFFTFDFGAIYEGYHSDTTRTVAVKSATDEMREIYSIVLKAQMKALTKVKSGILCSEIDKTARDIITEAGYGEYFGHSTGHGVGLDIHELPFVSAKSETVLKAGMVITDEPGIYLPNQFGVRIEDMLCVTDDGYQNFVNLPKELIIV